MATGADATTPDSRRERRLRTVHIVGPVTSMASETDNGSSTGRKRKKKRTVVNRQKHRPGQFLKLRGVLDQPTLWEHAATIAPKSCEGAPRKLPEIAYLLMPSLSAIWGSFSKAETALNEPEVWEIFCKLLCEMQNRYRPQDEAFNLERLLATTPLTAQDFFDARRSWLTHCLESLEITFAKHAAEAARELGYADPDGPGSCNNLTRTRTIAGDGKVTREPGSRYATLTKFEENLSVGITAKTHVVDKTTGEIIDAADMEGDAHLYITGGGPVVGFKTVRLSLRNDETNSTVIVAVKRPATKDEAGCAVDAALDVKRRLPAVLGLTYDTAIRGTHIRRLAREGGLVTTAPIAAKSVDKTTKKRREKTGYVASVPHLRPDNGLPCEHQFHHEAGRLHELKLDSRGKKTLVACADPTVRIRHNKDTHRMYLEWEVLCDAGLTAGSKPAVVDRLTWSITDDGSDFNVAENLRALPPGSDRYAKVHGWRQTVENDNNQSDTAKSLRRGRSSRPEWNHLNEIGWAIVQNGVAIQRHRQCNAGARNPDTGTTALDPAA